MFRKRERKSFPPGTFIATPARVAAILHLCFVFSFVLWHASQPFMGELFSIKKDLLLLQEVTGVKAAGNDPARLERNRNRFAKLPKIQREQLIQAHDRLAAGLQSSFFHKLGRSFALVCFELPLLVRGWIILSIAVPLLLLLKREGGVETSWLLLFMALAICIDNRLQLPAPFSADLFLYPTERVIIEDYLMEPLESSISGQYEQLKRGWQMYLVKQWAGETPHPNHGSPDFRLQAEKGEYAFNAARAQVIAASKEMPRAARQPLLVLGLFLAWHCYFLAIVIKALRAGKRLSRQNIRQPPVKSPA